MPVAAHSDNALAQELNENIRKRRRNPVEHYRLHEIYVRSGMDKRHNFVTFKRLYATKADFKRKVDASL